MNLRSNSSFKQWQPLPLASRSLREGTEATRLPECRTAEFAGLSFAQPERGECRSRPTGTGRDSGTLGQDRSTIPVLNRHD